MERIIFLDIDGVLNSVEFLAQETNGEGVSIVNGAFDATSHIDPVRVARLNRLIELTGAEVVLSSSWRVLFGLERTQTSLTARGFAHSLKDCTIRLAGKPRYFEIATYLERVDASAQFVILDDDAVEIGEGFGSSFIHVPDGLENEHIEQAKRVFFGSSVQ